MKGSDVNARLILTIFICICSNATRVTSLLPTRTISRFPRTIHIKEQKDPNYYSHSTDVEVEEPWKQYQYQYQSYQKQKQKPHVTQYKKHGIFYKTSVLSQDEFKIVQEDLQNLSLKIVPETTSSVAHKRIGAQLPPNCRTVRMLSNPDGSFAKIMNEIMDMDEGLDENPKSKKMKLSPIVPVEMRIYEQRGAGMEWHKDDVLYSPEQIEVVFTVENNSDCVTMWEEKEHSGSGGSQSQEAVILKQVETEANSAIVLRAGEMGARHSVSSLRSGRRVILKFVFIREDAEFLEGAEKHSKQFASQKKSRSTKRSRRAKK